MNKLTNYDNYIINLDKNSINTNINTNSINTNINKNSINTNSINTKINKNSINTKIDKNSINTNINKNSINTNINTNSMNTKIDTNSMNTKIDKNKRLNFENDNQIDKNKRLNFENDNQIDKESIQLDKLICKFCNRKFKRKSPKVNHEKKQLCVDKKKRTMCIICNLDFNSVEKYKNHLTSENHIKTLFTDNIDDTEIIKKKKTTLYDLDPYLSNIDKNTIQSKHGKNITLKYTDKNGYIINEKINLNDKCDLEKEIIKEKNEKLFILNNIEKNDFSNKGYTSYEELIKSEIYDKPIPNKNQEIILCKLVDLNDEITDDKQSAFLKILKYLDVDDSEYMTTYIRDCNGINLESKQIYIELITKFVNKLTQIYNQGYTQISGKNIQDIISKLNK